MYAVVMVAGASGVAWASAKRTGSEDWQSVAQARGEQIIDNHNQIAHQQGKIAELAQQVLDQGKLLADLQKHDLSHVSVTADAILRIVREQTKVLQAIQERLK